MGRRNGGAVTGLLGLAAIGGQGIGGMIGGGAPAQQQGSSGDYASPQQNWNNMIQGATSSSNPMRVNDVYTNPTGMLGGQQMPAGAGVGPSGDQAPIGSDLARVLATTPKELQTKDFLDGYFRAQENNRANTLVGDKHEEHLWAKDEVTRQKAITDGMTNAATIGGFNGVIDFLSIADPERAIKFTESKNTLDQHMMQTSVMKALLPGQQAQALAEGYGVLGKMGSALLQAPEKDRASMYKTMLPMIKTINPNASDTLDADSTGMFMLAVAQSTPENILYGNKLTRAALNSDVGKSIDDLHTAIGKYGPDSPEATLIRDNLGKLVEKKELTNAKTASVLLQKAQNNNISNEAVLRKEVENHNKNFYTIQDNYNKIKAIESNYQSGTMNAANYGPSDVSLIFNFMKILDPTSVVRESEFATAANSGGVPQSVRAEYNKVMKGGVLSPLMRNEFIKTASQLYEGGKTTYDQTVSEYRKVAIQSKLNPDNVVMNMDTSLITTQKQINQNADALIAKYKDNPEAISKIEAKRKADLEGSQQAAQQMDMKAQDLRHQYGR